MLPSPLWGMVARGRRRRLKQGRRLLSFLGHDPALNSPQLLPSQSWVTGHGLTSWLWGRAGPPVPCVHTS